MNRLWINILVKSTLFTNNCYKHKKLGKDKTV